MKKVVLLLFILLLSPNCSFANNFLNNFAEDFNSFTTGISNKLKPKTSQDRLAPVRELPLGEMTLNEKATLLYNENNIKASLDTLLCIKEFDRTAQDWLLIGNILYDQDKIADAVFMYKKAITTNPKFYKSYYNLGNIYLEDEKPFLAIENYRKANTLNPQFAYSYYNLGCAYLKAGNLKKAKIAFLKAVELKNTEPDFHYNLAYTYKKLKNDKLAKQYLGFYNKLTENNQ